MDIHQKATEIALVLLEDLNLPSHGNPLDGAVLDQQVDSWARTAWGMAMKHDEVGRELGMIGEAITKKKPKSQSTDVPETGTSNYPDPPKRGRPKISKS